jgi:hypothetical protein
LIGINLRAENQTKVFSLSFQQHSYAVPIDGHVSIKQGQGLMDTICTRLPISNQHNKTMAKENNHILFSEIKIRIFATHKSVIAGNQLSLCICPFLK